MFKETDLFLKQPLHKQRFNWKWAQDEADPSGNLNCTVNWQRNDR